MGFGSGSFGTGPFGTSGTSQTEFATGSVEAVTGTPVTSQAVLDTVDISSPLVSVTSRPVGISSVAGFIEVVDVTPITARVGQKGSATTLPVQAIVRPIFPTTFTETDFRTTVLSWNLASDWNANTDEFGVIHPAASIRKGHATGHPALAAMWRADETGTTVVDVTGNGNSATVNGATIGQPGMFGSNSVNFGNKDNQASLDVGSSSWHVTSGDPFTIASWVYWNDDGSLIDYGLFESENSTQTGKIPTYGMSIENEGGSAVFSFRITGPGGGVRLTQSNFPSNKWTHLAVRVDPVSRQEVTLFLNGQNTKSVPYTGDMYNRPESPRWGTYDSRNGQFFAGRLDEMHFYTGALSSLEISDLHRVYKDAYFQTKTQDALEANFSDTQAGDGLPRKHTVYLRTDTTGTGTATLTLYEDENADGIAERSESTTLTGGTEYHDLDTLQPVENGRYWFRVDYTDTSADKGLNVQTVNANLVIPPGNLSVSAETTAGITEPLDSTVTTISNATGVVYAAVSRPVFSRAKSGDSSFGEIIHSDITPITGAVDSVFDATSSARRVIAQAVPTQSDAINDVSATPVPTFGLSVVGTVTDAIAEVERAVIQAIATPVDVLEDTVSNSTTVPVPATVSSFISVGDGVFNASSTLVSMAGTALSSDSDARWEAVAALIAPLLSILPSRPDYVDTKSGEIVLATGSNLSTPSNRADSRFGEVVPTNVRLVDRKASSTYISSVRGKLARARVRPLKPTKQAIVDGSSELAAVSAASVSTTTNLGLRRISETGRRYLRKPE